MTRDPASSSPAEDPPSKQPFRLWLLLAAHVILGPLFCFWSAAQGPIPFVLELLLVIPAGGFVFAQTSLLGFWAAFSSAKWWMRLAGLIIGSTYLEFLISAENPDDGFLWLAALATGGTAAVFGLIRWRYADLRRFFQSDVQTGQQRLKFSIRNLMHFTFAVAVTIVGAKALRDNSSASSYPLMIFTWSLCFILVGLASVWAGLGLARPLLRSVIVLLVSAVLGVLFIYGNSYGDWKSYFYTISIMLLQAGVLIASLLVVRSCGYRLVRKSTSDVEPLD